jgi:signal transduction histidine kinase
MSVRDLKLGTKQLVGFGIVLLTMTSVNIFSIQKMKTIRSEFAEVTTNLLPRATAVSDINLYTSDLRLNQLQHALVSGEENRQISAQKMIKLIDRINTSFDTYDSLRTASETRNLYSAEEKKLFAEFDHKWDDYQALSFLFFKLARENKQQKGIDLLNGEARDVFNDFSQNLVEIVSIHEKDVFDSASRVDRASNTTRIVALTLLIISVTISIVFVIGLVRWITVPLYQLEKAARSVAEGDLDTKLQVCGNDEIGNVAKSFNTMTSSLNEATGKLKDQTKELQIQADVLQSTNKELKGKSKILEKQKTEIVQRNLDLYATMEELKSTQEQLLLKEKMASLGDLVAGVAHEINNPIGVVASSNDVSGRCVNRIEESLNGNQPDEQIKKKNSVSKTLEILKESITTISKASNRISDIVKSLKNFSRLDESEFQIADIHEGIESSLTLMGSEFQQRISVVKEYGDLPRIECYPGQLNQVFINLLKNAMNAIEDRGSIHVKTFQQQDKIFVQISDTGKGIKQDRLKDIFNFNISKGKNRIKLGSGLATVYNIIQKHDGEINVQSKLGEGSTFLVSIPINLN